MFDEAVKQIIDKLFKTKYSYLQNPSSQYARITKVRDGGYNLKIIDKNGNDIPKFPIIPNVKSDLTLNVNDDVVIMYVAGNIDDIYIVGKVMI